MAERCTMLAVNAHDPTSQSNLPANGAFVCLRLQCVSAAMAHAHVPARERCRVPWCTHADDTLI